MYSVYFCLRFIFILYKTMTHTGIDVTCRVIIIVFRSRNEQTNLKLLYLKHIFLLCLTILVFIFCKHENNEINEVCTSIFHLQQKKKKTLWNRLIRSSVHTYYTTAGFMSNIKIKKVHEKKKIYIEKTFIIFHFIIFIIQKYYR